MKYLNKTILDDRQIRTDWVNNHMIAKYSHQILSLVRSTLSRAHS